MLHRTTHYWSALPVDFLVPTSSCASYADTRVYILMCVHTCVKLYMWKHVLVMKFTAHNYPDDQMQRKNRYQTTFGTRQATCVSISHIASTSSIEQMAYIQQTDRSCRCTHTHRTVASMSAMSKNKYKLEILAWHEVHLQSMYLVVRAFITNAY